MGNDTLFEMDPVPAQAGFRGPQAATAAGITYRQLDYWDRCGLVTPSLRAAKGSGSQRLYGFRDVVNLRMVKRLLDTGIALQQIRKAVGHLAEAGVDDLSGVTLLSDGVTIYTCTENNDILDLLAGGQGMFAIGLSALTGETTAALIGLPFETPATSDAPIGEDSTQHRPRLRAV
jgi:DNA-binding transcriptional MerR regulator